MSAVFNSVNPGYILVSDKPLVESEGKIRKLNAEQIKEEFHFKYEENMFLSVQLANFQFGHDSELSFIWQKINQRLENPLNDKLVICFIDDKVGYGVFAREFIEAGTIIGLYSGEIEPRYSEHKKYGMIFRPDCCFL